MNTTTNKNSLNKNLGILLGSAGAGKTAMINKRLGELPNSNFSIYDILNKYGNLKNKYTINNYPILEEIKDVTSVQKSIVSDLEKNCNLIIDEAFFFLKNYINADFAKQILQTDSKILFVFQSIDQIKIAIPYLLDNCIIMDVTDNKIENQLDNFLKN